MLGGWSFAAASNQNSAPAYLNSWPKLDVCENRDLTPVFGAAGIQGGWGGVFLP